MNKLLMRGLNAYKIFLKNKLAMALMMLFSGVMMFIAALNGHGNDTKTLPLAITFGGLIFAFWAFYRLGYIKSNLDKIPREQRREKDIEKRVMLLQIAEAAIYVAVAVVGIFLLANQVFVNKVLNLMAGGFTILNGVLGAISTYKNRENKDFRWKFLLVLMVFEFIIGPYFIIMSDSLGINDYIVMGALTTVAGTIEVISALTKETIKSTIKDTKDIVHILKDDETKKLEDVKYPENKIEG